MAVAITQLMLLFILLHVPYASNEDNLDENRTADVLKPTSERNLHIEESVPNDIRTFIDNFELNAALAEKHRIDGGKLQEPTKEISKKMAVALEEITESLKQATKLQGFVEVGGINRIILPNLLLSDPSIRKQTLITLKMLFENNHSLTVEKIPSEIVDKLMQIFEKDDNVGHKAHVVDILQLWLPGNPKVQARFMRKNGIDVFYNQISNLNSKVTYSMLALFNNIIVEHINAANDTKSKDALYRQMGFIQKISTTESCDGLLEIFQMLWTYNTEDDEIFNQLPDLMINVKDLCMKRFKHQNKALNLFRNMLNYVQEKEDQADIGVAKNILNDIVGNLTATEKDEL